MNGYSEYRICNVCGDMKGVDEFPSNGEKGIRPSCKECWNSLMRIRRRCIRNEEERKLYDMIERIWILTTHDYTPMEIFKLLTEKF